jgi:hypothetical protein
MGLYLHQARKSRRNTECKELSSVESTILPGWGWTTFMRFRGPQALKDRVPLPLAGVQRLRSIS